MDKLIIYGVLLIVALLVGWLFLDKCDQMYKDSASKKLYSS